MKATEDDVIVPFEMAQIPMNDFVSIELTQIPNVMFATG